MAAKTARVQDNTTQDFLDIYDIANNFVFLKDGTVSIILTVNAMNFGLLAEAEQDAVMYAYAGLLNSLNYPVQIIIQSKTKDATTYLSRLKSQEEKASSAQKRELIARYRQFVNDLIKERNVLDKKFYVVVPASATELGIMPAQTVLPGSKTFQISDVERSVVLEKAQTVLEPKRDHLLAQFNRIGLFAKQLSTQEIIQVFYNNYNPESYEGQELTDTSNYTTPLVQAQIIGGNMNSPAQLGQTLPNLAPNAQPPVEPGMAAPTPTAPVAPMSAPMAAPAAPAPAPATTEPPHNIAEPADGLNIPTPEPSATTTADTAKDDADQAIINQSLAQLGQTPPAPPITDSEPASAPTSAPVTTPAPMTTSEPTPVAPTASPVPAAPAATPASVPPVTPIPPSPTASVTPQPAATPVPPAAGPTDSASPVNPASTDNLPPLPEI